MQRPSRRSWSLFLVLFVSACGARTASTVTDASTAPRVDRGSNPPPIINDAAPKFDTGPEPPLLQAVLGELRLPSRRSEYGRDIDGDGRVDNALGALLGQLGSFMPLPFEELTQQLFSGGGGVLLFDIYADGFDYSSAAEVRLSLGYDADDDPNNDFSGNGVFYRAPEWPYLSSLYGGVREGRLGAEGEIFIPLGPFDEAPLELTRGFMMAETFQERGLWGGVVNGAIPWEVVQEVLLPVLIEAILQGGVSPQLLQILDTNGDGQVTAEEVAQNPLVGMLFRPDLDLDGDNKPDAFSVGFGFSAVRCTILE